MHSIEEDGSLSGPSASARARRSSSRCAVHCAVLLTLVLSASAWSWTTARARERDAKFASMLAQLQGSVNASTRALEEIAAVASAASATSSFAAVADNASSAGAVLAPAAAAPVLKPPVGPSAARGAADENAKPAEEAEAGESAPYTGCFAKGQVLELDEAGGWSLATNYSDDALYLAIPLEQLGRPFTVVCTAGRVSGLDASILHYGVGVDDSLFHLRLHPHKPAVDVVRPQLAARAGSTAYAAAQAEGHADIGWTAELPAAACTSPDLQRGRRVEGWPPTTGARKGNATVLIVSAFEWVMSGLSVVELGEECEKGKLRLVKARAFASNLQFVLTCGKLASREADADDDGGRDGARAEPADAPRPAVEYVFSLAFLPRAGELMTPRRADDRVGYFGKNFVQVGGSTADGGGGAGAEGEEAPQEVWAAIVGPLAQPSDIARADADRTVNIINRWRLAKARPGLPPGELSPPVKPITFHIDPTVPRALWATVASGALAWNEAFEAIGYAGAIRVLTPDDSSFPPDYDAGDIRFSSITWLPYPSLGLAIGPTHVDPRTGEILYANVVFGEGWLSALRGAWYDDAALSGGGADEHGGHGGAHGHAAHAHAGRRGHSEVACHMSAGGPLGQLQARLVAQGALPAGAPVPEAFVRQGLHDIVAHEVGHTLGLRHNFKASALFSLAEVHAQSNASGIVAASVMDYLAPVVAERREEQGLYFMRAVGPYDKWAIRYGYSQLAGSTTDARHAELLAIAAELAERPRELQRADDADARVGNDASAMPYDFSADPLDWCEAEERALKRVVGSLGAWRGSDGSDTVWLRRYESALSSSLSTIGRFWAECAEVVRRHSAGLAYDRANREQLSAPVPPAQRARALERACAMLSDDALAAVPRALMARSASFEDEQAKWGLKAPYAHSLQLGLSRRVALMKALASPEQLRWVDTLAWLERGADGGADGDGGDGGDGGGGGEGAAMAAGATEALLLPWYAQHGPTSAAAVRSSSHALARLSACVLQPLLAGEPGAGAGGDGYELARATQAAWVDVLASLHARASNGTLSSSAGAAKGAQKLPADGLGEPFNAHGVRAGTEAILLGLSDRLDGLVGGAERPLRGANSTAYFASGLRRVVRAALREGGGG